MPQLIKDRAVRDDRWTLLREAPAPADLPSGVPVIVPLALWLAHRDELRSRGEVGVWLAPHDEPATLASDTLELPLIAVDFPQFTDGRGYSMARLLRDRHGFRGELRAIGDVQRDQLFALAECGFDAFAVRADRDAEAALVDFDAISGVYASTSRTPQPWFRRRAASPDTAQDASRLEGRVAAAIEVLRSVAATHAPAVLASSFGAEDMVLIDLIARHALPIGIFMLDTGRLPEDTHALVDRVRQHYALPVAVYAPDARLLQDFVAEHGVNAFYRSVDLRKGCCAVRKTEPLRRALAGKGAWITGMRRAQSVTRQALAVEEYDTANALPKFNPLADWDESEVWDYLRAHRIPRNALHERGYPSIGCAPCTRAVQPGEDTRAGRWWWEAPEHKECGLHARPAAATAPEGTAASERVTT